MAFECFFQILNWRQYCGRFTDIIPSEYNWFLLPFLITVGKGKRAAEGEAPRKFLTYQTHSAVKRPNAVLSKRMRNSTDKSKSSNGCMQKHKKARAALFLQNKKIFENKPFNVRERHFCKREDAKKRTLLFFS